MTPVITVCLTTYKRPHMVKQAVESFLSQSCASSELLIIDDCPEDDVTSAIIYKLQRNDKRIRYIKNKHNIGFSKNLLQSMLKANGKYLYIMGDDDVILGKDTLEKYIKIFDTYATVDFIYSNIIQFNNNFSVDYFYNHFPQTQIYQSGQEAIEHIWLKSMYIGGIGLRRSKKINAYYPKDSTLFPIVELVGKILLEKDACGFSNISIGMRVHPDQLGVHVMNKKRVKEKEKHGYIELYRIADRLRTFIKDKKKESSPEIIDSTVNKFLASADKSILLTEGFQVDRKTLLKNIYQAMRSEKRIFHTLSFWIQLSALFFFPHAVLLTMKNIYINYLRNTQWKEQVLYFNKERKRIFKSF